MRKILNCMTDNEGSENKQAGGGERKEEERRDEGDCEVFQVVMHLPAAEDAYNRTRDGCACAHSARPCRTARVLVRRKTRLIDVPPRDARTPGAHPWIQSVAW